MKVSDLKPAEYNPRKITDEKLSMLDKAMRAFGDLSGVVFNRETGNLIGGHQRVKNLDPEWKVVKKPFEDDLGTVAQGYIETPFGRWVYREVEWDKNKEAAANVAANQHGGEWLYPELTNIMTELDDGEFDMDLLGFDDGELENLLGSSLDDPNDGPPIQLKDRFVVPPFSVLDTKQGYWQERKKAWEDKIKDQAEAREFANAIEPTFVIDGKLVEDKTGGVSLLDPVLSEIINKWFNINAGKTFDCFAGDTVFGFVSSHMGNGFTGIELRDEQVVFNQTRVDAFHLDAKYICDDGQNVCKHIKEGSQDLFFSCPPYYDLEVYSDNEKDASNQNTYENFYKIIDTAFSESSKCLKDNRFAVVVCGDVRDKKTGEYYRFPDDIKTTFIKSGFILYNELILCEMINTARLRCNKYMKNRKVVKTHQNVLVFYKGDTKKIKGIFQEIPKEDLAFESDDME